MSTDFHSQLRSVLPRSCGEGVPREGETLTTRITSRSRADYKIDHETGCWVWQKALDHAGYGSIARDKAHRQYFRRANPDIDITGLDVHHRCHNPACVNPDHLEAVSRVKHLRDHKRTQSVLSEQDVADIRASSLKSAELGEKYGVPAGTIRAIWQTKVDWAGVGVQAKPQRDCEFCGDPIPATKNRQARFCTVDCRTRWQRAKKHKPDPSRWKVQAKLPKEMRAA